MLVVVRFREGLDVQRAGLREGLRVQVQVLEQPIWSSRKKVRGIPRKNVVKALKRRESSMAGEACEGEMLTPFAAGPVGFEAQDDFDQVDDVLFMGIKI